MLVADRLQLADGTQGVVTLQSNVVATVWRIDRHVRAHEFPLSARFFLPKVPGTAVQLHHTAPPTYPPPHSANKVGAALDGL